MSREGKQKRWRMYPRDEESLSGKNFELTPWFRVTCRRNLAQAYYQGGRVEDAATELKELIELTPDDMTTYYNLVVILAVDLKDPEQAREYLQQAVARGGLDDKYTQQLITAIEAAETAKGKAAKPETEKKASPSEPAHDQGN